MSQLFLGFYLGAFCIILLINFLSYIYFKEKAYLYYFFMHLCLVLVSSDLYKELDLSISFFVLLIVIFTYLFVKEFLNLEHYNKKLNKIINIILFVLIAYFLFCTFTSNVMFINYTPYSLVFLILIYAAIDVYKKGFKLAKYFIAAWGINIFIIMLSDIERIFNIYFIQVNYYSQIGSLLEGAIMSIVLFAKTKQLIDEQKNKERILIHQSRLASMGEMLANISHQWRQPLNRIASFTINMQMYIEDTYKKEEYLNKKLQMTQDQLDYMSQTIDDFSSFYNPSKSKEYFFVSNAVKAAINIISPSLKNKNINLIVNENFDFEVYSYPKELSQVMLNLIQNAKDAILINKVENGEITININRNCISVEDNGLGINQDIIYKIFDPYFTTKELNKGTGIGLYMSKIIIENNMKAKLKVENKNNGAKFTILFF